mmetsp:Transcript_26477/g.84228  ORF Transcript_26477/g.84228 Transcript_26477/m.84228 type:complete len:86 (-) Transcript_26477:638-895(-)
MRGVNEARTPSSKHGAEAHTQVPLAPLAKDRELAVAARDRHDEWTPSLRRARRWTNGPSSSRTAPSCKHNANFAQKCATKQVGTP